MSAALLLVATAWAAPSNGAEASYRAWAEGTVLHAEIAAELPFAAAALWPPLGKVGAQHPWVPYMRTASVTGTVAEGVLCSGHADLPWPLKDRTWTVSMRSDVREASGRSTYVASWNYVPGSGNLVDSEGYWSLEDLGEGRTQVRLVATADLGAQVPASMLSWARRRALPEMLGALLVEAGVVDP